MAQALSPRVLGIHQLVGPRDTGGCCGSFISSASVSLPARSSSRIVLRHNFSVSRGPLCWHPRQSPAALQGSPRRQSHPFLASDRQGCFQPSWRRLGWQLPGEGLRRHVIVCLGSVAEPPPAPVTFGHSGDEDAGFQGDVTEDEGIPSEDEDSYGDGKLRVEDLDSEIASIAFPALLALAADPVAALADTYFLGCLGAAPVAAVGVSLSAFNYVAKICNIPLLNITTSFVAEAAQKTGEDAEEVEELATHPEISSDIQGAGWTGAYGDFLEATQVEATVDCDDDDDECQVYNAYLDRARKEAAASVSTTSITAAPTTTTTLVNGVPVGPTGRPISGAVVVSSRPLPSMTPSEPLGDDLPFEESSLSTTFASLVSNAVDSSTVLNGASTANSVATNGFASGAANSAVNGAGKRDVDAAAARSSGVASSSGSSSTTGRGRPVVAGLSGTKKGKPVNIAVSAALILGTVLGVVEAVVIAGGAGGILSMMGVAAASDMRAPALQYLRLRALGAPALVVGLAVQGAFRGYGDTRTPLFSTIAANAVNCVLTPFLMFGLKLGISGAAIGTVCSQYVMAAILLLAMARRVRLFPRRLSDLRFGRFLHAGGLLAGRTLASLTTMTLATSMAARLGTAPMAAHQICLQVWLAASLLSDSMALAGQTLLARAFAQDDALLIHAAARRVMKYAALLGCFTAAAFALGRSFIPRAFTHDPAVLAVISVIMPLVALTQPINALAFVWDGLHYGASDFAYSAYSMLAAAAPALLVLLVAPKRLGLPGVWMGLATLMFMRAFMGFARMWVYGGPWKKLRGDRVHAD